MLAPRGNPTSSLATGFLTDDTYQQFDLGSSLTWTLQMTSSQEYNAWHSVQINAGMNTQEFDFNTTDGSDIYGLKWVSGWPYVMPGASNDFAGWLGMFLTHLLETCRKEALSRLDNVRTITVASHKRLLMLTSDSLTFYSMRLVPRRATAVLDVVRSNHFNPCSCAQVQLIREFAS